MGEVFSIVVAVGIMLLAGWAVLSRDESEKYGGHTHIGNPPPGVVKPPPPPAPPNGSQKIRHD